MQVKNFIFLITFLLYSLTNIGQQKENATATVNVTDFKHPDKIKGKNLIVNDTALNKYIGTWAWEDGDKTLKIVFTKQIHHYGSNGKVLDVEIIMGSFKYSENGQAIISASGDNFNGSSGGKKDTLNVFLSIKSRSTHVTLLVTYLNNNSIRLELDRNRFEFKNDKNFEVASPITLTRQ